MKRLPDPLKVPIAETIGFFTGRWRSTPSFFLIGAHKSGTTSLYDYLSASPGVHPARRKELNYYSWTYHRSKFWYRALFPLALGNHEFITGEATPNYLFHPNTPARLAADFPDARIIISLREPAARAYSHYRHTKRMGHEPLDFDDALRAEPDRLCDPDWDALGAAIYRYSYRTRGFYAEQIRRWLEYFDREQMFIFPAESLFADPRSTCDEITNWLGVEPVQIDRFEARNTGGTEASPTPSAVADLREHFRPANEELFELLGSRFDW